VLVCGASSLSLVLLAFTLTTRLIMGWLIGIHWLRDGVLKQNFWLLPIRDLLSFVVWCVSWIGKRVEWRGRLFEVAGDGKMIQVAGPGERAAVEAGRSRVI